MLDHSTPETDESLARAECRPALSTAVGTFRPKPSPRADVGHAQPLTRSASFVSTTSAASGVPRPLPTNQPTDACRPAWLDTAEVAHRWHGRYRLLLVSGDAAALTIALATAFFIRFGTLDSAGSSNTFAWLAAAMGLLWLACMFASNAYDVRRVESWPEEWHRLVRAAVLAVGASIACCYYVRADVARGFLALAFPLGLVTVTCARLWVRRIVRVRRTTQAWQHRVLAVGAADSARRLIETSTRVQTAGMLVVGVCADDAMMGAELLPGVPVVGRVDQAADLAAQLCTDVVALAGGDLDPPKARELSWKLEGTGRRLVMMQGLTDVARPRLHLSPLDGLPLVWVDQPQFSGPARSVKRLFDIVLATLALLVVGPFLLLVALAIRKTTSGPALFKQSRLGRNGDDFTILKFRTMYVDAETRRAELEQANECSGALFKVKDDPRITPIGGWLRRLSIDELPQLVNVLRGDMSLVGPRPLPTGDSTYTGAARRRLLVRPGITGLWQVSGRSDLSWDEAVRLDLYYVENWSLAFDLSLIARTVIAIARHRGAY